MFFGEEDEDEMTVADAAAVVVTTALSPLRSLCHERRCTEGAPEEGARRLEMSDATDESDASEARRCSRSRFCSARMLCALGDRNSWRFLSGDMDETLSALLKLRGRTMPIRPSDGRAALPVASRLGNR